VNSLRADWRSRTISSAITSGARPLSVDFTLKQRPLARPHLDDFVAAYRPGESSSSRIESEDDSRR
jgi:hypothetical protein